MKRPPRVLVVDDEEMARRDLAHVLKKQNYDVTVAATGSEALKLIELTEFDVVLTDLKMAGVDGMEILRECKRLHPLTEVIVITGYATVDSAIDAMRQGAYHYIPKPYRVGEVRKVLSEAVEKVLLRAENLRLKEVLREYEESTHVKIITQNAAMLKVLETARQAALVDCNVLITGESGTGKDLMAKYIHEHSRRHKGPFLAINCGAFNQELLANELFGHEKGAFTGAGSRKIGIIEAAAGGTLFLDEVTEMAANMQVKLLRVIQEKQVMRLGGTTSLDVDVRFVAATNRRLDDAMESGKFRRDLFYRLNVVSLAIPSLAERRDDIQLLCNHFLAKHAKAMERPVPVLSPEVRDILQEHAFPGNVRELENIIERGVALCTRGTIETKHLPDEMRESKTAAGQVRDDEEWPTLAEHEIRYIQRVLEETEGNKTLAASILGIDRVSLWRKIKRFGLEETDSQTIRG
ncbi:MAG: sigma-54 dependent transcriptional regulator [Desulfomonilaceae bacterium]|nr:sigma-54 dependent transcriptional regulator [Desulfomonilaceae bacterium]